MMLLVMILRTLTKINPLKKMKIIPVGTNLVKRKGATLTGIGQRPSQPMASGGQPGKTAPPPREVCWQCCQT